VDKSALDQLRERLKSDDAAERAAAVAEIAEALAAKAGLSWDQIFERHKAAPPADAPWTELPIVDDDAAWAAHTPAVRGYPGYRRRYRGRLLVVRERGRSRGGMGARLPYAWYATCDGELAHCRQQGHIFFHAAEEAMTAAEQLVDDMENA